MGVYLVTLPEGAYTTQDHSKTRVVVAGNSTDAIALAATGSDADAAPWADATAVLVTGTTDFSRFHFGFTIVHDGGNGFAEDVTVEYTPLPTDTVDDIGEGLVDAAVAAVAGLSGTTYSANVVTIAAGANCGESVINVLPLVWEGELVKSDVPGGNAFAIGGNDFPNYVLTDTSILPTIDAAALAVGDARHFDLTPLTTGINPGVVGELVTYY